MAIGDDDEQARLEAASGKADGASLGRHAAPEEAEVETVRLLITGYGAIHIFLLSLRSSSDLTSLYPLPGPFRGYPTENPSTLTARHLDGLVLEAPAASSEGRPRKRRVEVTFRSLAVTYAEINKVIPPLHREHAYDAFVHVGVASRARDGLRLEQLGRKGPYDAVDSEKRHCPTDIDGSRTVPGWAAKEDAIRSSLDLPALLACLQIEQAVEVRPPTFAYATRLSQSIDSLANVPSQPQHVRLSSDAGLYLCEYVYAVSAAFRTCLGCDQAKLMTFPPLTLLRPRSTRLVSTLSPTVARGTRRRRPVSLSMCQTFGQPRCRPRRTSRSTPSSKSPASCARSAPG
jgi:hypothetical protein